MNFKTYLTGLIPFAAPTWKAFVSWVKVFAFSVCIHIWIFIFWLGGIYSYLVIIIFIFCGWYIFIFSYTYIYIWWVVYTFIFVYIYIHILWVVYIHIGLYLNFVYGVFFPRVLPGTEKERRPPVTQGRFGESSPLWKRSSVSFYWSS